MENSFIRYLYKIAVIIMLMFIIIMVIGCSTLNCKDEREAHYINANRYIPILKNYIEKDASIHQNLKDTYFLGLDTWMKLIKEKKSE